MAIGIDITLLGDEELARALDRLTGPQQKKAFRKSVRVAFKPVLAAAKARVRVRSGKLKKSLKLRALKRSRRAIGVEIETGSPAELGIAEDDPSYYPMSLEAGTARAPAQPYLRPAFDENEERVASTLKTELGRNIDALWDAT